VRVERGERKARGIGCQVRTRGGKWGNVYTVLTHTMGKTKKKGGHIDCPVLKKEEKGRKNPP